MSANQLLRLFAEHQRTDLRTHINDLGGGSSQSISESDGSVGCSTSTDKQTMLMRRPCYGLYCCIMVKEFQDGLACFRAPY